MILSMKELIKIVEEGAILRGIRSSRHNCSDWRQDTLPTCKKFYETHEGCWACPQFEDALHVLLHPTPSNLKKWWRMKLHNQFRFSELALFIKGEKHILAFYNEKTKTSEWIKPFPLIAAHEEQVEYYLRLLGKGPENPLPQIPTVSHTD